MPGVIQYAVSRILERGDSIRRGTKDLNDLHHVEVSVGTVETWTNEYGEKEKIAVNFMDDPPPDNFSGFLSLDGTFKSVNIKKKTNSRKPKWSSFTCYRFNLKETNCRSIGIERK